MPKIFVTYKFPGDCVSLLSKHHFQVEVNGSPKHLTKDELKKVFEEFDGVVTLVNDKVDEDVISSASRNLKIISNYGVGFDNIDVLAANKKGIIVTNTPGVASESVAEFTIAFILACSKKLIEADKYVRQGKYTSWDPNVFLSSQVWGKTIGIIGLGKIGMFVGHIAHDGFNMNVLYHDIQRAEDFELLTEAKYVQIDRLLRDSDFVSLHVPLTPQTKHLISRKELKMMKERSVLINTSRGPVVDEDALIWALKEGEIAAAGLDVYEHEPHIAHELLTLSNVVLTPHIASATEETRNTMSKIAAENIIDVFEGKEPFGLVKVS